MNPFLQAYDTPFETHPFDKIKLEHYMPAIEEAIRQAKADVDAILNNASLPSFENTIVALENSGDLLDKVTSAFFNLNSAETSEEMQQIAQQISPLLTEYKNDIMLNEALFEKVRAVHESGIANLNPEQSMLLKNSFQSFERNGANLSKDKKDILRELDTELSKLSLKFGENVLKESNSFQMLVDNQKDLEGLPDGIKEAAANLAKSRDHENTWMFTLDYPSYIPFMTYSSNRTLRKKMHLAFSSKAFANNEFNNTSIVNKLVQLRGKRAKLLGFESHADFTLVKRMAETSEQVFEFLDELQEKALPFAHEEFKALQEYANKQDGIDQLEKWDGAFYSEKLKKEKFNIDDELLRPYFKLENVIDGVFKTAEKLYQLNFEQRYDIPLYHDDVMTYEVKDEDGKHVAILYADFFPRAGKRQGAWMTVYRSQKRIEGQDIRPHISIVCNFTKPTESKPSLLTFNEVTTLFHEFGHALHGILADGTYSSLSGTSVYWDFVELPSQIFENWCYEKDCLDLFAAHYKTGETIPQEYIDKIKASANFMSGMATIRQISLAKIDMGWHSEQFDEDIDVKAKERALIKGLDLYPAVEESCTSTQFSHIFQGGYSSGYYSYKWAEVLDADAFEAFQENGIFDSKTADSFKKHVLSAGAKEHPSELYRRFRGRDANPDALLKRAGLVK